MDNDSFHRMMHAATDLTRMGKVKEATEAIQRALASPPSVLPGSETDATQAGVLVDIPGTVDGAAPAARSFTRFPLSLRPHADAYAKFDPQRQGVAATPAVAPGARYLSGSYSNAAGTRAYKLYVPSTFRGQGSELVVMLHGCTQSADDFAAGTRMNALAEERACLVLYPVQARTANAHKCWNWFKQNDQSRDAGEPALIAGLTREISSTYAVEASGVYVAGLSAGGAMAVVMGATYPDLYAAVGVHSGLAYGAARDLPSALAAMKGNADRNIRRHKDARAGTDSPNRPVPTIVFHGDRDTVVHPRNGDQVIVQGADEYHTLAGTKLRMTRHSGQVPGGHGYTRDVYWDSNGQPFQEYWNVHGAGHAWAGGSPDASYTDPKGPDAAREMLRFFEAQRKARP